MTHNGYSLKRPTLKTNYIKILSAVDRLNSVGHCASSTELQQILGIYHDDGFHKALSALKKNGYVAVNENDGKLWATSEGIDLLDRAAESAGRNHISY